MAGSLLSALCSICSTCSTISCCSPQSHIPISRNSFAIITNKPCAQENKQIHRVVHKDMYKQIFCYSCPQLCAL
ncbi:hypothetical protein XELAEV_18000396mg [Xenopus laevis]|uniref:Secreted protein n=1 Tax=Xenopus laevis TaxID=8355 RepID=A0A974BP05_XENLA|nr:hypothetical protein XELAEV_18000396mg [Xenopus laevis]